MSSNDNEKNFQYPKYTRKLFLADEENNNGSEQNQQSNSYTPNEQQIQGNIMPPIQNQAQQEYSMYNFQAPYVQPTPSIPLNGYYSNSPVQQPFQHSMGQPQYPNYMPPQSYGGNYMPTNTMQYYTPPNMQLTPNYVQMMTTMQENNQNQYSNKTSLKLKNQGLSLDDYNESDDETNENNFKSREDNKKKNPNNQKSFYSKRQDNSKPFAGSGKNYKKPIISYEDNYMKPQNKTKQKVVKKNFENKEIKINSFAAKYKKAMESKEAKENPTESKPGPRVSSESDSDSPPEEVKIEKHPEIVSSHHQEKNLEIVSSNDQEKHPEIVSSHEQEKQQENMDKEPKLDVPETTSAPLKLNADVNDDASDEDDANGDGIDNSEDEHQKNNASTTFIPGTTISLTSDDDIKNWQQQRRINWLLKVSNKKDLHNEILTNPDSFKDSSDEQVQKFIKFQQDNNLTSQAQEQNKNSFREFGKIKETVKKMFQQIEKDDHQNNSTGNIASMKLQKIEEQNDNLRVLEFIKLLGDLQKLDYKLTDAEKEKLFGNNK